MVCPKCGYPDMVVSVVAENKKRGCLMSLLWILLACCTFGIILIVPLLTKKGSKLYTHYVCPKCGYHKKVRTR